MAMRSWVIQKECPAWGRCVGKKHLQGELRTQVNHFLQEEAWKTCHSESSDRVTQPFGSNLWDSGTSCNPDDPSPMGPSCTYRTLWTSALWMPALRVPPLYVPSHWVPAPRTSALQSPACDGESQPSGWLPRVPPKSCAFSLEQNTGVQTLVSSEGRFMLPQGFPARTLRDPLGPVSSFQVYASGKLSDTTSLPFPCHPHDALAFVPSQYPGHCPGCPMIP